MEKVKLTQDQANIISSISLDELGEWFYKDERTNTDMYAVLKDFTMEKIAKAKIIGYEVKPEFKPGDYVVNDVGTIGLIKSVNGDLYKGVWIRDCDIPMRCTSNKIDRHATPKEVEEAKERRWWTKHDRGVWELREGDALKAVDGGHLVEVCEVFDSRNVRFIGGTLYVKVSELKEGYKIVCFAEDRKDLGDD